MAPSFLSAAAVFLVLLHDPVDAFCDWKGTQFFRTQNILLPGWQQDNPNFVDNTEHSYSSFGVTQPSCAYEEPGPNETFPSCNQPVNGYFLRVFEGSFTGNVCGLREDEGGDSFGCSVVRQSGGASGQAALPWRMDASTAWPNPIILSVNSQKNHREQGDPITTTVPYYDISLDSVYPYGGPAIRLPSKAESDPCTGSDVPRNLGIESLALAPHDTAFAGTGPGTAGSCIEFSITGSLNFPTCSQNGVPDPSKSWSEAGLSVIVGAVDTLDAVCSDKTGGCSYKVSSPGLELSQSFALLYNMTSCDGESLSFSVTPGEDMPVDLELVMTVYSSYASAFESGSTSSFEGPKDYDFNFGKVESRGRNVTYTMNASDYAFNKNIKLGKGTTYKGYHYYVDNPFTEEVWKSYSEVSGLEPGIATVLVYAKNVPFKGAPGDPFTWLEVKGGVLHPTQESGFPHPLKDMLAEVSNWGSFSINITCNNPEGDDDLSGGAIAGIVIGSIVLVAGLVAAAFFFRGKVLKSREPNKLQGIETVGTS